LVNRCRDVQRRRRFRDRERPDATESHDQPDHLRDAIAALPVRERTAIVLRFYQDLSIDEIAHTMATRPGTVKSLLHRAVARLRRSVEP
jgi:RNA polymerase sigma factor (sigma-70 family)